MFFFLPIGLDESGVNRLPWVTISIAATCLVMFLFTWVLPSSAADTESFQAVASYWLQHPGVKVSEELSPLVPGDLKRAVAVKQLTESAATVTEEEQATFDQLTADFLASYDHRPIRRLSLVPARGVKQIGWLTHMFLHFGWIHLLGNLLFLYLVAPFLEDAWGRGLFAGFYLVGGLAGAAAQFFAEQHLNISFAGASGPIAACMGAFMFRFATRRIRVFYFIWLSFRPFTGTFLIRAWLAMGIWIADELLTYWIHGSTAGGVAVLAHIGGFGFGAAVALGLKVSGIEQKVIAPSVEATHEGWTQLPAVGAGQAALESGDRAGARKSFREALDAQPQNRDAGLGLARLEFEEGRNDAGARALERALSADLAKNDSEAIRTAVLDLGSAFSPAALKPAVAYRIAQALEQTNNPALAEITYAAAGAIGGTLGAKALLRAAELRLASHTDVQGARPYLERLRAIPETPPDSLERAKEIEQALSVHGTPGGGRGISLDESAEAAGPGRPTVRQARLLALAPDAAEMEDEMQRKLRLPLKEVLAIAVGVVPAPDGSGRNAVITDLVVSWGGNHARPTVVRLPGGALSLPKLYPDVPATEAYGKFLARLFEASGASGLPDKDELLKGKYPRYADLAAFEAACYAPA